MKQVLFLFLLLLYACTTVGNTLPTKDIAGLSGVVKGEHLWKGSVIIDKDLLIAENGVVKILPGTIVFIAKSDISRTEPIFLYPETEIVVKGKLIIEGNKDKPVVFLSLEDKKDNKDWAGIVIQGGELKGQHFIIKNAYTGISVLTGTTNLSNLQIRNSNIGVMISEKAKGEIKNVTIKECQTGMVLDNEAVRIEDVSIFECNEGLLIRSAPKQLYNFKVYKNIFGAIIGSNNLQFLLGENNIYENKNNLYIFDASDSVSK